MKPTTQKIYEKKYQELHQSPMYQHSHQELLDYFGITGKHVQEFDLKLKKLLISIGKKCHKNTTRRKPVRP